MELIYRGAEAELWKSEFLGIPVVIKRRIKKAYRHPELDKKIIEKRMKNEARMLILARSVVKTPHVLDYRPTNKEIVIEWINGEKVRDTLYRGDNVKTLGEKMGETVRKMHDAGIIHNDLTTSNFLWDGRDLWLIDFGLAERSERLEDKATDLVVFKRMLKASHWEVFDEVWSAFINGYRADNNILERVDEIEKRAKYMR